MQGLFTLSKKFTLSRLKKYLKKSSTLKMQNVLFSTSEQKKSLMLVCLDGHFCIFVQLNHEIYVTYLCLQIVDLATPNLFAPTPFSNSLIISCLIFIERNFFGLLGLIFIYLQGKIANNKREILMIWNQNQKSVKNLCKRKKITVLRVAKKKALKRVKTANIQKKNLRIKNFCKTFLIPNFMQEKNVHFIGTGYVHSLEASMLKIVC